MRVCGPPLTRSRTSLGEVAQEQDFVFTFVEFHEVSVRPFLQPVEGGPLNSSLAQCGSHAYNLVPFANLLRVCSVFRL